MASFDPQSDLKDPPEEFLRAVFELLTELGYAHNCVTGTIHITRRELPPAGYHRKMAWIAFDGPVLMVLIQPDEPLSDEDAGPEEAFIDLHEPDSLERLEAMLKQL